MSPSLHPERLVPYLLAALLVTAAIPAMVVPASTAADAATDPEVRFAETIYHEQRGDVFEIGVSLSGTDVATMRIGPDANDSATVVVRDADGDGRATVLLNTYDWTFAADGNDSLTVREPASDSLITDGNGDAVVHPGDGSDRDPTDVATLVVSERVTDDLRPWVASKPADFPNLSAVNAAKASENLTRSDELTRNDTLVLELRASGLEGALAAQDGSNATARFFALLDGDAVDLGTVQINPGPSIPPKEIHLAEYDSTRFVTDPANDTYYLVADLSDVNVTGHGGVLREGDEYETNFSVGGQSALASNGTEAVTAEFGVVESRDTTTADSATHSTTVSTTDVPVREKTTASPTATPDEVETTDSRNDGDIPGFGAAAALVALLAVALLARRR